MQSLTDEAADAVTAEGNTYGSPQRYGTAVHKRLADEINNRYDPNLVAEKSYIKSEREGYGQKGSIRVDVLELTKDEKVCVYDIKTGQSGLTPARMIEIAGEVHHVFGGPKPVIVIETRPGK